MQIALPLKYRPQVYEDILGQPLTVKYLQSLSKQRVGRNLVVSGSFGAGKTSLVRIYAKSLNCKNISPTGSPCNACESCLQSLDIHEIDAASTSGKEDVKDLLEIAKQPPMFGKYRVIIADEAHQFSKSAWDALLKSIEEPKPYQVFLFSTTEIDKVREAIRSRCQCLEVKLLPQDVAKAHLKKICELEGFVFEDAALDTIVFMSKGHPRDLLKNLEQVSFMGDVSIENCKLIFNLGFLQPLIGLLSAIVNKETKSFRMKLEDFNESPKTILEILRTFVLHLYYNFGLSETVELNPAFLLIPHRDRDALWKKIEAVVPKDKTIDFLSLLNSLQDSSIISFEIALQNLYNFIHIQGCQKEKFGEKKSVYPIKPSEPGKIPQNSGRIFVTDTKRNAIPQTKAPAEIVPIIPKEPDKIYMHTLSNAGWKVQKIKNDSDLIILEEDNAA